MVVLQEAIAGAGAPLPLQRALVRCVKDTVCKIEYKGMTEYMGITASIKAHGGVQSV